MFRAGLIYYLLNRLLDGQTDGLGTSDARRVYV